MSVKSDLPPCISPTDTRSWHYLQKLASQYDHETIASLFEKDPKRCEKYTIDFNGIILDFSRQRINDEILDKLLDLMGELDFEKWRDAMFSGKKVNLTENRPALHTALRAQKGDNTAPDNPSVLQKNEDVLRRMADFVHNIQESSQITDIVNIGIGGSYLGPQMAVKALAPYHRKRLKCHFLSNIDGHDISCLLRKLNPQSTLFIIASKSFNTEETLINAQSALKWFLSSRPESDIKEHFIALTANHSEAQAFGLPDENIFPFEKWVGGRFSLWSSIGLPVALTTSFECFKDLLEGARAMDAHFKRAPLRENLPVLLALSGLWNHSFLKMPGLAILPYDQRLDRLPAYLQQLEMESNGKAVDRNNQNIEYPTAPIIFGEPGTNGQHAFYQLMHQGTVSIASEMIAVRKPHHSYPDHHKRLISHLLAQASALAFGENARETRQEVKSDNKSEFKNCPGNRPSTLIVLDELTPYHLGQLLALYEHKVFTEGILRNINSFDQWGVELGKKIAKNIYMSLSNPNTPDLDPACVASLRHFK